ncbi:DUF6603 domain-containing protein [Streptomyces sp. NPDC017529]|uniref:DUF6603 domain-containing protein n=1 Tax=Streptomyces sp. NPDC017529 TaxID=3365000 RepID=UPI0037A7B4FE
MSDEKVWEQLPDQAVADLTSASLRLDFLSDGKIALGIRASGTAGGREWSVGVALAHTAADGRMAVVAGAVRPQLSLAQLPVVGPRLPQGAGRVTALAVLARTGSKAPSADMIKRLQALLTGAGVPQLSAQSLSRRASLGIELTVAGTAMPPFWVGTGGGSKRLADSGPAQTQGSVEAGGPDAGAGAGGGGAVVWVEVNKALGPLQVHRVGLVYTASAKRLAVLVDASLGAVGLVFDAVGLGLAVTLDKTFAISGALDGLGLSYAAGPVKVAGALVRQEPPPEPLKLLIGGLLAVTTPQLGFLAAGMYGQLKDGRTTVFLIGQVTGLHLLLGPVEVTGFVGGLGYNSRLQLPERAEDVASYPLVAGIGDDSALPLSKGAAAVLKQLGELVTAAGDHLWIAVGAQFTVFKVVEASVVVALQVSPGDVMVALLGVARVRFPQTGTPYAGLTLGLRAVYRYATGELSVGGALDPAQSYVVSRDCKVTGAFAMCTWLPPSSRAGDFVISFGGYHPAYRPPAHYPQSLARIGIDWRPSDAVVVRGEAYAAVTPSMLQVGGALRVEYSSSRVSAWLRAHLDATVQWEPFRFEVDLGIEVGAEVRFMGTHRVELEARLNLWGPPTGGVARLKLPVVPDVYVRFGAPRPAAAEALEWPDFHSRVLADAQPQLSVARGLVHEQPAPGAAAGKDVPKAALGALVLSVRTPAPATHLRVQTGAASFVTKAGAATQTVGVRPMNKSAATAECTLTLTNQAGATLSLKEWAVTPASGKLPISAWGAPLGASTPPPVAPGKEVLETVVGAQLVPPAPTRTDPLIGPIPKDRLEATSGKEGGLPKPDTPFGDQPADGTRASVAASVGTATARQARQAVYERWKAVGLAPPDHGAPAPLDALGTYTARLWSLLPDDPMLIS